jgi:predicted RNA-binding protein with PIN domain
VAELEAALAGAREERAAAVRDLKGVEARAAARLDELRQAQEALAAARRQVDELASGQADEEDDEAGRAGADVVAGGRGPRRPDAAATPERARPTVDRDALARAVEQAAQAATLLSAALAEAAAVVADAPSEAPSAPDPSEPHDHDDESAVAGASTGVDSVLGAGTDRPARRQPTALPIGVFDDTPEAALHLLRTPGATLAVDGYNVSLAGWPTLALSAQRHRLVDAVGALAARTRCTAVVVFDGADVGAGLPGESRPRGVQVRFTPPDVEADDELLALVDALPLTTPVVVASSDRRVADGARRRGANVISGPQLLGVLGVEP